MLLGSYETDFHGVVEMSPAKPPFLWAHAICEPFLDGLVDDNVDNVLVLCLGLISNVSCRKDIQATQFFQEDKTIVCLRAISLLLK